MSYEDVSPSIAPVDSANTHSDLERDWRRQGHATAGGNSKLPQPAVGEREQAKHQEPRPKSSHAVGLTQVYGCGALSEPATDAPLSPANCAPKRWRSA